MTPRLRRAPRKPRQLAAPVVVQRSEPRPMPSVSGAERAVGRGMPRESRPPQASSPAAYPRQAPPPHARRCQPQRTAETEAPADRQRGRQRPARQRRPAAALAGGTARREARPPTADVSSQPLPPRVESGTPPAQSSGTAPVAAVPRPSRPADGRYPVGQATAPNRPIYGGGGHGQSHYVLPVPPAYYYGDGAFGLGYFYYDPYWSVYSGYGYRRTGITAVVAITAGAGITAAATTAGAAIPPGGSGYYGTGSLHLKVKPRDAEVYVDGYYSGSVDDFDGTFQKLELEAGPHRIEVRKPGFATLTFEVRIPNDESVTYRGELSPQP